DVDLVAMTRGTGRAVVADGQRQEMEHQVRVGDLVVAPGEAAALEVVRRTRAAAEEQPLEPDPRPTPLVDRRRLHRHRLGGGVLDVDLEVVLEMVTDAGQVLDDVDPEGGQLGRVADARQLEPLRRVDRPAGEDDLLAPDELRAATAEGDLDADRGATVEDDPTDERARSDLEVRTLADRVEVGPGGAQPAAPADVPVERREAFLAIAVDVIRPLVAGLHGGLE